MGLCARECICAPFMLVVNEISTHELLTAVPHPTHTHPLTQYSVHLECNTQYAHAHAQFPSGK